MAVLIATASVFAGNFEAKPINPDDFKKTAWDRDYEFFLSVSQLFTVPTEAVAMSTATNENKSFLMLICWLKEFYVN